MVRIWQQARQDVALPAGYRATLRIGGEAGLWNRWLHLWVSWMRGNMSDIALRCEVGLADDLMHGVLEGLLDIGVTYSPQSRSSLTIVRVAEEELVLVEAGPRGGGTGRADQIFVDWGEEFRRQHRMMFPDVPIPALSIGLGTLGFDYLLRNGGKGYFPRGLAEPHLASGRVRIVPQADIFLLPIYAVHASSADPGLIGPALAGLRTIVAEKPDLSSARRPARARGGKRRGPSA
jgi:DNA-binding transcriptional LysR family regulator